MAALNDRVRYLPNIFQTGTKDTTLHQQLLNSHMRVAALAALVLVIAVAAMQLLRAPISKIQHTNVPSANAAMTIQLGLQRSEANLRGWVALESPPLRDNVELAWSSEIEPAFELLRRLSEDDAGRRTTLLNDLETKLNRLKKLQDWTIAVSAKAGNEPAKLVFSQEYGPTNEKLVTAIEEFTLDRGYVKSTHQEQLFELRLALSEAEAALGRYVVEGEEVDANTYVTKINLVQSLLNRFSLTFDLSKSTEQFGVLERLSESIIDSRRSPRSNVAWHTISTQLAPLSADIASELAAIADDEVSGVRNKVEQIAIWFQWLSICSAIAVIVVIVIALLLSNVQAKRISRPVTQLFSATEALKNGDYHKTLSPEGVKEVQGLIGAFNAMRESILKSHQVLEEMAFSDELTGLANRKVFNDAIASLNQAALQEQGFVGVLVIDLDYFKQVNDSLGHDAGDWLLSEFGNRLQAALRPNDLAARVGGDEFAVLLLPMSKAEDAEVVVNRILESTSRVVMYQGAEIRPSATIGVAAAALDNLDAIELVKKADLALYDAKNNGRGSYSVYSSHIYDKVARGQRLAEVVELNEPASMFTLHYQPYVELSSGRIVGVEALLRSFHPECQDMPILEVIQMLERNGHIDAVSLWVVDEATRQLNMWINHGAVSADFTMSINVSAALLRDADFVEKTLDIVEKSGVSGNSLIFEITETTVMEDYSRSRDAMSEINAAGVAFAMDDFGTGYSSLVRLKEMPVSLLKIDKTFIDGMISNANDAAIVDASVRLSHAIGMSVTAEGIETEEQADALQRLGCDKGQGYYFARPQAPEKLEFSCAPHSRAA